MTLDLLHEIESNKFLIILMEEKEYLSKLEEIIKSVEKTRTKICYVCLSKTVKDVAEDLKNKGFRTSDFFFIDVLTSHYQEPEMRSNCIFVRSPNNLASIRVAIKKAVDEKNCSVILFDTISTLLIYQQTHTVVDFTHHLISEDAKENIKKLFIVLKHDTVTVEESERLTKDLGMFADKTISME